MRLGRVGKLLERVGLPSDGAGGIDIRMNFRAGQRQRIRMRTGGTALEPKFIVCDEPVSALDVSVQAQILNLLQDLQKDLGLAFLFIAHNLAVVEHFPDRVAVMYLGKIVELAEAKEIYKNPKHPYGRWRCCRRCRSLRRGSSDHRIVLGGEVPSKLRIHRRGVRFIRGAHCMRRSGTSRFAGRRCRRWRRRGRARRGMTRCMWRLVG